MASIKNVHIDHPFTDQKPGTSGLRKSTKQFLGDHYLEIFIEAILISLNNVEGSTLIVGGDGRYGNDSAIKKIIKICCAHKVGTIIVPQKGLLSTPAASDLIRTYSAIGGIILSASHNPGGIEGDFGVKLNVSNGGPAPETVTEKIYKCTQSLTNYQFLDVDIPSLDSEGCFDIYRTKLTVIDGVKRYVSLMEDIFDFDQIGEYVRNDFSIIFDAMNAVTGPYAKEIFVNRLGLSDTSLLNSNPLPDFGHIHPDPNLTYAKELADLLLDQKKYSFGAACDGDGDRNMILGKGCFINPSDSLAVITANTSLVPGYKNGISGVARSMPTSMAVDVVAKELDIPCFETPTGWKFFGNLLDSGKITICGEESFGTGSNHVREKDGLWAVLFWLQILAQKKCSVIDLIRNHWIQFGRNYYTRHDYEAISSEVAYQIYEDLKSRLNELVGSHFASGVITKADNYSYTDPIDRSISDNQGLRMILDDGSRVILRLSGTGTKGSTLRLYFEKYVKSQNDLFLDPQVALRDLIFGIDKLLNIKNRTKMDVPTVIT